MKGAQIIPITIDLRKRGCEELHAFLMSECKNKHMKPATMVIELLHEVKRRRESPNGGMIISDIETQQVLATVSKSI